MWARIQDPQRFPTLRWHSGGPRSRPRRAIPPMAQPAKLILVDAHSLIFQVFHALRMPMSTPDGRPSNAVYGFTRDIFTLRDELAPDYLIFAFDLAGPTFRSTIEPEYKAHRPPPPDDLQIQFPMIQQVVE